MTAAPRAVRPLRAATTTALRRGHVVLADIGETGEPRPFVVVSNDRRNRGLSSILVARVSTIWKPSLPTVVQLDAGDPVRGYVLCDEVMLLWHDEVVDDAGALSADSLERVSAGLASALALG